MGTLLNEIHTEVKTLYNSTDVFFGNDITNIPPGEDLDSCIQEEHNSYKIEIAVPGMSRNDIAVQVDGSVLQVSTVKRGNGSLFISKGFHNRHFDHSFILPPRSDVNNIKAKCRNGLLTIRIGKIRDEKEYSIIKIKDDGGTPTIQAKMTLWWNWLIVKSKQILRRIDR